MGPRKKVNALRVAQRSESGYENKYGTYHKLFWLRIDPD